MTAPDLSSVDLAADSANQRATPDSPALKSVSDLVAEWDRINGDIRRLAEAMDLKAKRKTEIEQVSLPAAMTEAGVTSFTTPSGRSVEVTTVARGNIPAQSTIDKTKGPEKGFLVKRRETCIAFVKKHWPGLVKTELSLSLGKGETELASRIAELIRTQFKLTPSVDETIHPATLNSHFNELREQGALKDVPVEPFALYVGPIAKIK